MQETVWKAQASQRQTQKVPQVFRMTFDLNGIGMAVFTVLYFCLNGNIRTGLPLNQEAESDSDDNFVKYK